MRILPLSEAKATLSELVADVAARSEEITITRNGRAAAVLVSHEEFESWKETTEILADDDLMREIRRGKRALQRGHGTLYDTAALDRLVAQKPRKRSPR